MFVEGKYTIKVIKDDQVVRIVTCNNIVTNIGKVNVFNGKFGSNVLIGTGRAAEALSTTALGNALPDTIKGTWKTRFTSSIDIPKNTITSTGTLVGRTGAFTKNEIITELGIQSTSGELSTYSLLRDIEGELTTITVNVGEIIEIEYDVTIQCTFLQVMPADSGLMKVITYRLPSINTISETARNSYVDLLKKGEDGAATGTAPTDLQRVSVGYTFKKDNSITINIPANVNSYHESIHGFLIQDVNGFTVGLFTMEPFKIQTTKDYTAKAVFDY